MGPREVLLVVSTNSLTVAMLLLSVAASELPDPRAEYEVMNWVKGKTDAIVVASFTNIKVDELRLPHAPKRRNHRDVCVIGARRKTGISAGGCQVNVGRWSGAGVVVADSKVAGAVGRDYRVNRY